MGRPYIDLNGKRFGRLTVVGISDEANSSDKHKQWVCRCDCGSVFAVSSNNLIRGITKSCGCLLRSRKKVNEFYRVGDSVYVTLTNCDEVMICDADDWSGLSKYTWYRLPIGYAATSSRKLQKSPAYFHHFLIDCPENLVRDHINRNKLDNRKSNLRILTIGENIRNSDYCERKRA